MNKPIEKLTAHFRNKISGAMAKVRVDEWDLDIYYKQTATLKEQSKIVELAQKGSTVEALVETLITRARNEDGTKMFAPADKMIMMNEVDPEVLIRVVGDMNSVDFESLENVEKN